MTWTRVCDVGEVAENTVKEFDIGGIPILLVNYGAGFRAIPPVCPHMEERLRDSGVVARCVLTCTKHLWAWNLATLEMQGETEKRLKTYDVKEEGGEILADIDAELKYDFDAAEEGDDDFFD
jgi:nitrite reductase/ring-hydroxylating ferredoxin subunit